MPRDIDVVGVWHGTPYQVASVSSTGDGVIVARGPAGFTFQAQADGQVRLALVGVREADDAVIVVTKQAATAPRLFRRYAPNVLMWTAPSHEA
jgi:hypothetical protein